MSSNPTSLAWTRPEVASPAAKEHLGRGAFRLQHVAAAAAAGASDAHDRLAESLTDYDKPLPEHSPVDSSRRALNIALTAALLGDQLDEGLRSKAAAAVSQHLKRIEQNLPTPEPARCETLTNWAAAALVWPSLPEARHAWTHALTALETHGHGRVHSDGTPRDTTPQQAMAWVEAALILGRAARHEGVEVPQALQGAAGAAAWHLYVRCYPDGPLPTGDVGPVLADTSALAPAARDATLALGWSSGRAACSPRSIG